MRAPTMTGGTGAIQHYRALSFRRCGIVSGGTRRTSLLPSQPRKGEEGFDTLHTRYLSVPAGEEDHNGAAGRLLASEDSLTARTARGKGIRIVERFGGTGNSERTHVGKFPYSRSSLERIALRTHVVRCVVSTCSAENDVSLL